MRTLPTSLSVALTTAMSKSGESSAVQSDIRDRRSLSSSTPSGVLVGATEGITYVSPKGDGRYVIANSKDQAVRLYDLRKMRQWEDFKHESDATAKYGSRRFDCAFTVSSADRRSAHVVCQAEDSSASSRLFDHDI